MDDCEEQLKLDIYAFVETFLRRPLGMAVFKTTHFMKWLEERGIECPIVIPDVKYYPVELFLFRVSIAGQVVVRPMNAVSIVKANEALSAKAEQFKKLFKSATNDASEHCEYRSTLGAHVANTWRQYVVDAVECEKLSLWDYVTKLPVKVGNGKLSDALPAMTQQEKIGTRERDTLLTIIAVLCREAKLDYTTASKTAALIQSTAATMGVSIGETTIEGHLKKIPDALGTRTK